MNRRDFVRFSAVASSLASVSLPLFAAELPSDLLRSPERLVGHEFTLDNGATLTLDQAQSLSRDARWMQWELRFTSSSAMSEGIHELRSTTAGNVSLFMQCNGNVARASISRLG